MGEEMLAIERKNEILKILQKEHRVLVSELSHRYEVTEETIRRDLDKLEKEGFVRKTYGGAVLKSNTNVEMPLKIREKTQRSEKAMIAAAVADLVEENDAIILDASSTSLVIAKALKKKKNIVVITNSIEILIEFAGSNNIKTISTGGVVRDASYSLTGKIAEDMLAHFNVDKVILSCKGIDLKKGCTDSNEEESYIKQAMNRAGMQTILAIDSSKFNQVFFAKGISLKEGDIVVTDKPLSLEWKENFQQKGVEVIVAKERK